MGKKRSFKGIPIEFHSFIPSFLPSVPSFFPSFIHSFLHSLIPSFIDSLISFIHSFIPSLHAFIHSFLPSFNHSFIHSLISFIHSFIHSFISFIHSFITSFLPSFLPSFIDSFIQSSIHSGPVNKNPDIFETANYFYARRPSAQTKPPVNPLTETASFLKRSPECFKARSERIRIKNMLIQKCPDSCGRNLIHLVAPFTFFCNLHRNCKSSKKVCLSFPFIPQAHFT